MSEDGIIEDTTNMFFLANMSCAITKNDVKQWFSQFGGNE